MMACSKCGGGGYIPPGPGSFGEWGAPPPWRPCLCPDRDKDPGDRERHRRQQDRREKDHKDCRQPPTPHEPQRRGVRVAASWEKYVVILLYPTLYSQDLLTCIDRVIETLDRDEPLAASYQDFVKAIDEAIESKRDLRTVIPLPIARKPGELEAYLIALRHRLHDPSEEELQTLEAQVINQREIFVDEDIVLRLIQEVRRHRASRAI